MLTLFDILKYFLSSVNVLDRQNVKSACAEVHGSPSFELKLDRKRKYQEMEQDEVKLGMLSAGK